MTLIERVRALLSTIEEAKRLATEAPGGYLQDLLANRGIDALSTSQLVTELYIERQQGRQGNLDHIVDGYTEELAPRSTRVGWKLHFRKGKYDLLQAFVVSPDGVDSSLAHVLDKGHVGPLKTEATKVPYLVLHHLESWCDYL